MTPASPGSSADAGPAARADATPAAPGLASSWLPTFEAAWRRSDEVFSWLRPDAWLARPIRLRQPFLFYLGHLPAFAWNQIGRGVLGHGAADPRLDVLFERGIDPVGVDEVEAPDPSAWPWLADVLAYRDEVRHRVRRVIDEIGRRPPEDVLAAHGRVLHLVLEHERMHQETLLYMLQELDPRHRRVAVGAATPPVTPAAAARDIDIPAGRVRLGATFEQVPFGWDNEFPAHEEVVPAFSIDALPVTNEAFLQFVEAGGYRDARWWSPEGWAWRSRRGMEHPHGWSSAERGFAVRTLLEPAPFAISASWPACVSWAEADAYARWRSRRLPSEPEWHRAAHASASSADRAHPWGDAAPGPEHGNFGGATLHPLPVGTHPAGASELGVHDLVGDGWEWTRTPFGPFEGFRPWARTYPGYSKDFFDGRHYVLLGASFATDRGLVRRSFRNWFQPHYPYVFTKFRTVEAVDAPPSG